MPARNSCISSGETSSKSIRTGIRCCTLTKLPAELSVGTSEYFDPRRFRNGRYGAVESFVPERIDVDTDFLSDENAGDLGLFVVCRDPFVLAADQIAVVLSTRSSCPGSTVRRPM